MIRSRGVLMASTAVKSPTTIWQGTPASWPEWLTFQQGSYAAIYERDLWTNVLVDKKAHAAARLPLHTYAKRANENRVDARATPYGQLLSNPSSTMDPYMFWLWVFSTLFVYGEAFVVKRRDGGGRPVELVPLHPTKMFDEVDRDTGKVVWGIGSSLNSTKTPIARRDFVHFRGYSPSTARRGLSKLEPYRATLENEYGARSANAAMWRNGGRPSVVLEHPGVLSDEGHTRLSRTWEETHGGVNNWSKAAILEDGTKASILPLNIDDLAYIDGRRLNREEACALHDVPPPVVHILDRATFSNITAQMRSMYRDTMAPPLSLVESTLAYELQDGSFGQGKPDFGAELYAEFLMEQVLRGDFEQRMAAYAQADFMTIAEKRERENLEFIPGTDRVFLNSASLPLGPDGQLEPISEGSGIGEMRALSEMLQKLYLSVGVILTPEEARQIVGDAGYPLGPIAEGALTSASVTQPVPTADDVRSIAARTGRVATVGELDFKNVCKGLTPAGMEAFLVAALSLPTDAPTSELRSMLRGVQ
jgi:HK97 family phage portal protein